MDVEKHLILIKGKDRTENISYCNYEDDKWQIEFGTNKTYSYNYHNVQWLSDPISLIGTTSVVYQNEYPLSGVDKIFDFGDYIRICFVTGYKKVCHSQEIIIEQSCLINPDTNNKFEYLKQLANKVSVVNENDDSFLSRQYEKITYISPSSCLAKYLHPSEIHSHLHVPMLLFPFGFNLSQKVATEKAFTETISVIEGPPGTGKTQTILNIIANAIINQKTVAVVSNNNSATANVLEKLKEYGVDFIAAYLGNKENKEKFFAGQNQTYPDFLNWEMDTTNYNAIKESLEISGSKLKEMFSAKNKVALLKQELAALLVEKKYFKSFYNETDEEIIPYRSLYQHNSDTIMALWIDFQQMAKKDKGTRIIYKLKNLLLYGIYSFSFYKNSNEAIIALFQNLYYEYKKNELNEQIQELKNKLENFQFDNTIKKYCKNSMRLFKAKLAEKFLNDKKRILFTKDSLWKDFDTFVNEYPVILSTTHSLRNCACTNYLFDYVIIDEASQVDVVTGALALSCAKNVIIVGDLKQLPNVVPRGIAKQTNRIFKNFSINTSYHYAENSILSSLTKLFKDVPRTLLREHYRCHPKIIGFCNQKFYNNELIVLTEGIEGDKPLVVYKTAKGNHARGNYNQRQIDVILQEVLPEQVINDSKQSVGIISPYRLHADNLRKAIVQVNIDVDTVHKYQGRERDVVILTTVVNEVNDFVDNPNLINVAISRAVDKLVLVVSDNKKNDNSNIGDLVKYIEYNNFEIIQSNIYSVFDLLYRRYSQRLFTLMKSRKKVSKYESENLMNAVIEKVLLLSEFKNLDRIMHQPLRMLIRNPEKLDNEEYRFAMNILTHTDFIIFNKLDKTAVLVVEVDGYAFHANNPMQLERDKMKDRILQKYGIPILRIGTNESGEETRLRKKLSQILNTDSSSLYSIF